VELAKLFFYRFRGLMRAYGTYAINKGQAPGDKTKIQGTAQTFAGEVTPQLWELHLTGKQGLGIVPINDDGVCFFGAIDIDVYTGLILKNLEKQINQLNLPLIVCRTKSGGAHLYLFLKEEGASAKLVRSKLMEWAVALGYPRVEVFPKQVRLANTKDFGSWINMPYFEGTRTLRYAIRYEESLTPREFLQYAEEKSITTEDLLKIQIPVDDLLTDAPPCLQSLSISGFHETTRNNSLFSLGVYCRKRFGDIWEAQLDLMNRQFMKPPLDSREVTTIIKSLKKKDYFYKCKDQPLMGVCNRDICLTRQYGVGKEQNDPGVTFGGLTKILTQPPHWIITVDSSRIELKATRDLTVQDRFLDICVEKANILPKKLKHYIWHDIVRELLAKVDTIEAPEDAGTDGQFMFLVEQFCSDRAAARNRDELILGKPWTESGWTFFRSGDLLKFLDQNRFREVTTSREAWAILRRYDAQNKQFNVKGKCVRCWGIPSNFFCKLAEDLSIPKTTDQEDF
jgi:hypothetical protein